MRSTDEGLEAGQWFGIGPFPRITGCINLVRGDYLVTAFMQSLQWLTGDLYQQNLHQSDGEYFI